jgi:hypothetical protein
MSTKRILQQILDTASCIVRSGRFFDPPTTEEKVVIKNAREIKRLAEQALRPEKPLRVKKWIRTGELDKNKAQKEILEDCGRLLDEAYSHEILGEVLFLATDGKYYVITVEALIQEANPEYVKDVISENSHNQ